MDSMKNVQHKELDKEWIALILQAKQLGLTAKEVRAFITQGTESKFMKK
ncbi:anti-repressor SinI family protein [Cytobacillus massiliigabonensis]|nr:anti-repressor SinI family protein [Cytobacillus massiliigabonensis]